MKKPKAYTPLFSEDSEQNITKSICTICGKTVNDRLLNSNGVCIECVMNNKTNSKDICLFPNERLFYTFLHQYNIYKKQLKQNNQNKTILKNLIGVNFGYLYKMTVDLAPDTPQSSKTPKNYDFVNQNIKKSSFKKCNKTTVIIRDESWVCPCCNHDNFGAHYCTVCGVYPKFKLQD